MKHITIITLAATVALAGALGSCGADSSPARATPTSAPAGLPPASPSTSSNAAQATPSAATSTPAAVATTIPPATPTAAPTKTPVPAVAATSTPANDGPQELAISARDFAFDPVRVTLKKAVGGGAAGSVNVSFANTGRASHTLTIYSDEGFTAKVPGGDTAVTPGGGSASFVFVAPATATSYYYRCEIHNSMQGAIEFK